MQPTKASLLTPDTTTAKTREINGGKYARTLERDAAVRSSSSSSSLVVAERNALHKDAAVHSCSLVAERNSFDKDAAMHAAKARVAQAKNARSSSGETSADLVERLHARNRNVPGKKPQFIHKAGNVCACVCMCVYVCMWLSACMRVEGTCLGRNHSLYTKQVMCVHVCLCVCMCVCG